RMLSMVISCLRCSALRRCFALGRVRCGAPSAGVGVLALARLRNCSVSSGRGGELEAFTATHARRTQPDAKSQHLPSPHASPQGAIGEACVRRRARSTYAGSKVDSYIVAHSFPVR